MFNTKKLIVVSFLFPLIIGVRFNNLRCALLRWAGAKIGKNVEIMPSAKFLGNYSLIIGNNCFIGNQALLFGAKDSVIELENFSKIGSRTTIVTGTHRFSVDGDCIEKEGAFKNIKISKGAVVSTGSIILPGITVHEMAHVAAGSVVTKDVLAFHRVAGVPARVIRDLRDNI